MSAGTAATVLVAGALQPPGSAPLQANPADTWWWQIGLILGVVVIAYLQASWLWRRIGRLEAFADVRARLHGGHELVVSVLWLALLLIEGGILTSASGNWLRAPVSVDPDTPECLAYLAAVGASGAACAWLWARYCAALPEEEAGKRRHEAWLVVARSQGAALCEELIFRLCALNALDAALEARFSPGLAAALANAASACAFGVFHWRSGQPGGAQGSAYMFLGSLVGGSVALWSGSIWPAAALHGPLLGTIGFRRWLLQWTEARKQVGRRTPLFLLRGRAWYFVTPLEGSRSWKLALAGAPMSIAIDKELVSKRKPLEMSRLRAKYALVDEPATAGAELLRATCAALFDPELMRGSGSEPRSEPAAPNASLERTSAIANPAPVHRNPPMKLDIHERDINSSLCRSCGACCRITLRLKDTNTRYRKFLRQIGYTVLPPAAPGALDCCEKKHDVTLDMGYCKHLEIKPKPGGAPSFRCTIYGTSSFPELCAQFNCVSWAKSSDNYSPKNALLSQAQAALDRQHAEEAAGRETTPRLPG